MTGPSWFALAGAIISQAWALPPQHDADSSLLSHAALSPPQARPSLRGGSALHQVIATVGSKLLAEPDNNMPSTAPAAQAAMETQKIEAYATRTSVLEVHSKHEENTSEKGKTTSSSQLEQMEVKVRGAGVPRASKFLTALLLALPPAAAVAVRLEPHSRKVTGGVRVGHNMSNPTQFAGPAALQTIRDADTAPYREDYITEGELDGEDSVTGMEEKSIFSQAAAAAQAIRDSPSVLYAEDYDKESVPGPLGLNSNTSFLRERDGMRRPLVLKSMEWPRRAPSPTFDNPEFHFACEVGFQQVAAKHDLAPAIVEYGWKRNGIGKKFHILMERKGKTLREWWKEADEADKAHVKHLTYELFDQLDMLGLHMEDPNPGNVLVETSPELRVFAIDFDPDTMDTNPKATREPRGFGGQVFFWLNEETAGNPSVWTQPWLRRK